MDKTFEPISGNGNALPENLKSGIEALSGVNMDIVKVHHNSDYPAHLQANDDPNRINIHLAQGQEKHLPHEAWHVVEQQQGNINPAIQSKAGMVINNDLRLEKEADAMGKEQTVTNEKSNPDNAHE